MEFANTLYGDEDFLGTAELASLWFTTAGLQPARDLAAARALRDSIHALFTATVTAAAPPATAIAHVNAAAGRAPTSPQLVRQPTGASWRTRRGTATGDAALLGGLATAVHRTAHRQTGPDCCAAARAPTAACSSCSTIRAGATATSPAPTATARRGTTAAAPVAGAATATGDENDHEGRPGDAGGSAREQRRLPRICPGPGSRPGCCTGATRSTRGRCRRWVPRSSARSEPPFWSGRAWTTARRVPTCSPSGTGPWRPTATASTCCGSRRTCTTSSRSSRSSPASPTSACRRSASP